MSPPLAEQKLADVPGHMAQSIKPKAMMSDGLSLMQRYNKRYISSGSFMPVLHFIGAISVMSYIMTLPKRRQDASRAGASPGEAH